MTTYREKIEDYLKEFIVALRAQLKEDEQRWGSAWKDALWEGQEERLRHHIDDYFLKFEATGESVPWLKVAGYALIGWLRELETLGGLDEIVQRLKLADDLFPGFKDRNKTITIRKGKRDIALGDLVFEAMDSEKIQLVRVAEVRYKLVRDITNEEARADGAKNRADLIEEMKRFYSDFGLDTEVTLILFEV